MFEEFLQRHYEKTYRYLYQLCRPWHRGDTARLVEDLNQQLWENAYKNFDRIQAADEPLAYLKTMAKNLVTKQSDYSETSLEEEHLLAQSQEASPELGEKIEYLHHTLIPNLSCKQRLAYLLYHESTLWEGEVRLGWAEFAQLNGVSEEEISDRFESVRGRLMHLYHREEGWDSIDLDCEEILAFLVWTQAQRASKNKKLTWDYFAKLLAVKPNVLTVRYKDAVRNLEKGMVKQFGNDWNAFLN